MKILVTGGGGFLGYELVKELTKQSASNHYQYEVHTLSRSSYDKLKDLGVTQWQETLGEDSREKIIELFKKEKFQVVFHTAALASMWGRWEDFYQTNTMGTEVLLEASIKSGVSYFIYTSSPSVVFGKESLQGLNEKQAHYPKEDEFLSYYAKSKALAEQMVLQINQAQDGGMKTLALRPHLIWGKGDPHLFPQLLKARKEGRLKIIGKGDNIVDMTHVKNAVLAHICALNALLEDPCICEGKAYFIGDEEPVPLWPFINDVLKFHREKPLDKKEKISLSLAYKIGAIFEFIYRVLGIYNKQPPMTRFIALQMATSHYFDHAAAVNDLSYEPKAYFLGTH